MKELLKEKDYYKTSDLSLASALISLGYPIEAIERNNPSERATFLIKRDDELDNLIQLYFTGQLRVEPLSYFNNLKNLKTRLYNIGS